MAGAAPGLMKVRIAALENGTKVPYRAEPKPELDLRFNPTARSEP
jgi:hypothetical protein